MADVDIAGIQEAEQYYLKALFILHTLQANKKVYGSNSRMIGVTNPADVDLALQYIDRSIEILPDNAVYLNLKGLFLWEGKGNKAAALPFFERAAILKPRDIDIQNNLNAIKSSQCVIATAAFGSPLADEVNVLRWWRDTYLKSTKIGRAFVFFYYYAGGYVAGPVGRSPLARRVVRAMLRPLIVSIKSRYSDVEF